MPPSYTTGQNCIDYTLCFAWSALAVMMLDIGHRRIGDGRLRDVPGGHTSQWAIDVPEAKQSLMLSSP